MLFIDTSFGSMMPEARQAAALASDETFELRHRGMTLLFGGGCLLPSTRRARVNFYEPLREQSSKPALYV